MRGARNSPRSGTGGAQAIEAVPARDWRVRGSGAERRWRSQPPDASALRCAADEALAFFAPVRTKEGRLDAFHFAAIPALAGGEAAADLNRFIASKRVVQVDRELVQAGAGSFWAVCVTWIDGAPAPKTGGAPRVDYRKVLTDAQFRVFSALRDRRKALAEADGVPAYQVFTNEQLAEIVRRQPTSVSELGAIAGVGEKRIEKYGEPILTALKASS